MNLWNKLLGKPDQSRDPLSCEAALGTGKASEKRLRAFFIELEVLSLRLQAIDGCGRLSNDQAAAASVRSGARELLQKAETELHDSYRSDPAAVQASLLMTYYSGDEGCVAARKYLLKWFKGCDVEGAHALLETYVGAVKACAFDEETQHYINPVINKCASTLPRWKQIPPAFRQKRGLRDN